MEQTKKIVYVVLAHRAGHLRKARNFRSGVMALKFFGQQVCAAGMEAFRGTKRGRGYGLSVAIHTQDRPGVKGIRILEGLGSFKIRVPRV